MASYERDFMQKWTSETVTKNSENIKRAITEHIFMFFLRWWFVLCFQKRFSNTFETSQAVFVEFICSWFLFFVNVYNWFS